MKAEPFTKEGTVQLRAEHMGSAVYSGPLRKMGSSDA